MLGDNQPNASGDVARSLFAMMHVIVLLASRGRFPERRLWSVIRSDNNADMLGDKNANDGGYVEEA
jgi:hypothetical protein